MELDRDTRHFWINRVTAATFIVLSILLNLFQFLEREEERFKDNYAMTECIHLVCDD